METRVAGVKQGVALLIAGVLPAMGVTLLSPNLPAIQAHFAGIPAADYWVSIALTAPALCIALVFPVAGYIVDRFGRRRSLQISLFLYAIFGMAPLLFNAIFPIIASRLLLGVVEALIITSSFALIGDYFQGMNAISGSPTTEAL